MAKNQTGWTIGHRWSLGIWIIFGRQRNFVEHYHTITFIIFTVNNRWKERKLLDICVLCFMFVFAIHFIFIFTATWQCVCVWLWLWFILWIFLSDSHHICFFRRFFFSSEFNLNDNWKCEQIYYNWIKCEFLIYENMCMGRCYSQSTISNQRQTNHKLIEYCQIMTSIYKMNVSEFVFLSFPFPPPPPYFAPSCFLQFHNPY